MRKRKKNEEKERHEGTRARERRRAGEQLKTNPASLSPLLSNISLSKKNKQPATLSLVLTRPPLHSLQQNYSRIGVSREDPASQEGQAQHHERGPTQLCPVAALERVLLGHSCPPEADQQPSTERRKLKPLLPILASTAPAEIGAPPSRAELRGRTCELRGEI